MYDAVNHGYEMTDVWLKISFHVCNLLKDKLKDLIISNLKNLNHTNRHKAVACTYRT